MECFDDIAAISHQKPGLDHWAGGKAHRYSLAVCQRGDLRATANKEAIAHDEERFNCSRKKRGKDGVDLRQRACMEEQCLEIESRRRRSGKLPRLNQGVEMQNDGATLLSQPPQLYSRHSTIDD
jgi:hypothetical protein